MIQTTLSLESNLDDLITASFLDPKTLDFIELNTPSQSGALESPAMLKVGVIHNALYCAATLNSSPRYARKLRKLDPTLSLVDTLYLEHTPCEHQSDLELSFIQGSVALRKHNFQQARIAFGAARLQAASQSSTHLRDLYTDLIKVGKHYHQQNQHQASRAALEQAIWAIEDDIKRSIDDRYAQNSLKKLFTINPEIASYRRNHSVKAKGYFLEMLNQCDPNYQQPIQAPSTPQKQGFFKKAYAGLKSIFAPKPRWPYA